MGIICQAHYRIPTMKLRAVVFDFDGVIANSEPLHFRALHEVLAETGVTLLEHDYYARYLGFDDVGALRAIGDDRGAPFGRDELASLAARKADRFEALGGAAAVLFPGAAAAIRRAARLVPIGIASGARRDEILRVLDTAGLTDLFAAIVAAEDVTRSKPDPAPYVLAVRLLASTAGGDTIGPADCVAIEDSRWGIESARQAGLRTIAVTHTYDLSELGAADLVLDSLESLDLDSVSRQLA
jgi:beta-phosphoglucomutase